MERKRGRYVPKQSGYASSDNRIQCAGRSAYRALTPRLISLFEPSAVVFSITYKAAGFLASPYLRLAIRRTARRIVENLPKPSGLVQPLISAGPFSQGIRLQAPAKAALLWCCRAPANSVSACWATGRPLPLKVGSKRSEAEYGIGDLWTEAGLKKGLPGRGATPASWDHNISRSRPPRHQSYG